MQGAAPEKPGPGWLGGLPIVVKDLFDVEGVRATFGSPIFAENVSSVTDLHVAQLEANGAIVLGKSNTPEFGAGANTFNEVFGATRNPWNTALTWVARPAARRWRCHRHGVPADGSVSAVACTPAAFWRRRAAPGIGR